MRQVVVRLLVNGDAEGHKAGLAGFVHGVTGVFQTIAAFVLVQVVGLAVGEDEQQALAF